MAPFNAEVVAAHGRHYFIQIANDAGWSPPQQCYTRSKQQALFVGDRVQVHASDSSRQAPWVVESVAPRTGQVQRSDGFKARVLAANVDQVLLVISPKPHYDDGFISRSYAICKALDLPLQLIANKADLTAEWDSARASLDAFAQLQLPIHWVSCYAAPQQPYHPAALLPLLAGKTTLIMGQSGMGKSSLLNVLVPSAQALTQVVSQALNSGKHTTTSCQLYRLPVTQAADARLIDTPGFSIFGIAHLDQAALIASFPEFHPYLNACQFYNCRHLNEPRCGVRDALAQATIAARRYTHYQQFLAELTHSQTQY